MGLDDPEPSPKAARFAHAKLDPASRLHLRIFALHLGVILVFNLPMIAIDYSQPAMLMARFTRLFALTASLVAMLALVGNHRPSPHSLGLWDEVLALTALSLGCSAMIRLMA